MADPLDVGLAVIRRLGGGRLVPPFRRYGRSMVAS